MVFFGPDTFTNVHVALSLVGIVSGLVVLLGLLTNRRLDAWTALFLATTVATSATGFGFAFKLEPPFIIGIISLVVLAVALWARYGAGMSGAWRWIYVTTAMLALYLNVFVLVVQSFQKVPALNALAPTQSEPPFAIAQGLTLLLFVALGALALRRFRPDHGVAS